jgi:hypothetical protein
MARAFSRSFWGITWANVMEGYPMVSQPTRRPANLIPTTLTGKPTPPWSRALAIAAAPPRAGLSIPLH